MITRVWGIVNSTEVEFHPIENKPYYWEGFAPISKTEFQDIKIWAENDKGARGYLECQIVISWNSKTQAKLLLYPYRIELVDEYKIRALPDDYNAYFYCLSEVKDGRICEL